MFGKSKQKSISTCLHEIWEAAIDTASHNAKRILHFAGTYGQTIAEYAYDAYGNILSAPNSGVGAVTGDITTTPRQGSIISRAGTMTRRFPGSSTPMW